MTDETPKQTDADQPKPLDEAELDEAKGGVWNFHVWVDGVKADPAAPKTTTSTSSVPRP